MTMGQAVQHEGEAGKSKNSGEHAVYNISTLESDPG